jgi:hypothetical protein
MAPQRTTSGRGAVLLRGSGKVSCFLGAQAARADNMPKSCKGGERAARRRPNREALIAGLSGPWRRQAPTVEANRNCAA